MRYCRAYLNHHYGAWRYNLKYVDLPVDDNSYLRVDDKVIPILCKIVSPGILRDLVTGEMVISTFVDDANYDIDTLSCCGYEEVSPEYVLENLKRYRSDAEQYRDRLLEIKKEIKEKNKKRCEQLKHL